MARTRISESFETRTLISLKETHARDEDHAIDLDALVLAAGQFAFANAVLNDQNPPPPVTGRTTRTVADSG